MISGTRCPQNVLTVSLYGWALCEKARDDDGGESGSEEEGPSKPEPCSLCQEEDEATDSFCRHQIDPKNRLYHQLTVGMQWAHDKAIAALNAYAEFLTLKVLEADFSTTIKLSPSDLIDQVCAHLAWHVLCKHDV